MANVVKSVADDRDFIYAGVSVVPPAVDLRKYAGAIENQYSIGSCTANAVVSACELISERDNLFRDLSRLYLYYNTRHNENRDGQEGASLRDAIKSAVDQGICLESIWSYDMGKENVAPPQDAYNDGKRRLLGRYESISTDNLVAGIKSSLAEGYPVVFAAGVSESIQMLQGPLQDQRYDRTKQFIGNHAMCVVGYDDEHQYFIVENSWGPAWGDAGYMAFPYSAAGDIFEAWSIQGFTAPHSLWDRIVSLYATCIVNPAQVMGLGLIVIGLIVYSYLWYLKF